MRMWGWWKWNYSLSWLIFNSVPHTNSYIIDAKLFGVWEVEREKKREVFRVIVNNRDKRLENTEKMLNFVTPSLNFRPMCSMWGSLIYQAHKARKMLIFRCFHNYILEFNIFFCALIISGYQKKMIEWIDVSASKPSSNKSIKCKCSDYHKVITTRHKCHCLEYPRRWEIFN